MSNKNPHNPRHCTTTARYIIPRSGPRVAPSTTSYGVRACRPLAPAIDPRYLEVVPSHTREFLAALNESDNATLPCPALPCPGLPCTRSSLAVRGRPRDIKHSRGRYKSAAQRDRSSLPHRVRRQWTGSRLRPVKRDGTEQGWTGAFCFCPVHQILAPARYQRVVSGPRRGGCK